MKLLVESQTILDKGIWKPRRIMDSNKLEIPNHWTLFEETEKSKFYVIWEHPAYIYKITEVTDVSAYAL